MSNIRIEHKIIISIVLFTLLLVGLQRYEVSQDIAQQFIASKKDKNTLLLNTIAPILGVNYSLGLDDANKEYLDQIVNQNSDMEGLTITSANGKILYHYYKKQDKETEKDFSEIDSSFKSVTDPITGEILATAEAHFDDHEYQTMLENNQTTTFKLFGITFVLLALFVILLKREFRSLKELTLNVLQYDPKINNFTLVKSTRSDEVGIIHNAIIAMVEKIQSYAETLDRTNHILELRVQERTKELAEANQKLREETLTDPLTGLSNRRAFESHFKDISQLAQRNGVEVSVIMCDIDHFKSINDTFGHAAGDDILRELGGIMKNAIKRSSDFIARYGGEEFVLVLYDTDMNDATQVCMRIQENIKSLDGFESQWGKIGVITMSFGIASIVPSAESNYENLIISADLALYRAKYEGRNRIVSA
ncbi:MAG: GGDEF domain-containing protein [Sulfuricurvum sp.]|nr:GGDEF domain-containing protein [Sulfuricurvum sp.]